MTIDRKTRNQSPLHAVSRSPYVTQCLRTLECPPAVRKKRNAKNDNDTERVTLPEWVEQYAELNAIDVLPSGEVRIGDDLTDLAVLGLQMCNDAERIQAGFSHDKIIKVLDLWLKNRRSLLVEEIRQVVAFIATNDAVERYCEVLLGTRDSASFALSVAAIRHFVWQAKRKLFGHNPTDPLMPILYGKQGMCKSVFVDHLISPLTDLSISARLDELTDGRCFTMVQDNYIIVLDELQKAEKAGIETLKSTVSGSQIAGRPMRTNAVVKVRNNATFIGTTNKPVAEMIRDSTGMRRFIQIDVPEVEKTAASEKATQLLAFDVLEIWRGIDEASNVGPIEPFRQALADHQKEITPTDIMEDWLNDADLKPEPGAVVHVNSSAVLFEHFRDFLLHNRKGSFIPSGVPVFARQLSKHLQGKLKTIDGKSRGFACSKPLKSVHDDEIERLILAEFRDIGKALVEDRGLAKAVRTLIDGRKNPSLGES